MKKLIFFICLISIFIVFAEEKKPNIDIIANDIKMNFYKKMKKEYGFELVGTGGGGVRELNLLALHFHYPNCSYELSEARKLIIKCSNDFLNEINSNEQFKSNSKIYPFAINNIDLTIGFVKNNQVASDGKIAYVSLREENIYYATYDKVTRQLNPLPKESFEEAVKIVQLASDPETTKIDKPNVLKEKP